MPGFHQIQYLSCHLNRVFRRICHHIKLLCIINIKAIFVAHKGKWCFCGDHLIHAGAHIDQGRCTVLTDSYNAHFLCHTIEGSIKGHANHICSSEQGDGTGFCDHAGIDPTVIIILGKIFTFNDRFRSPVLQSCCSCLQTDIKITLRSFCSSPETECRCHTLYMIYVLHNGIKI